MSRLLTGIWQHVNIEKKGFEDYQDIATIVTNQLVKQYSEEIAVSYRKFPSKNLTFLKYLRYISLEGPEGGPADVPDQQRGVTKTSRRQLVTDF